MGKLAIPGQEQDNTMTDSDTPISKNEIIAQINDLLRDMSEKRLQVLLNQLKGSPTKWHRKLPRKPCIISVDFDTQDYSNQKTIRNLNVEGAYIEVEESFALGQEIILWFSMSGDTEISIKVPAKVVRRDTDGIGVKFGKISREQQELLKKFES